MSEFVERPRREDLWKIIKRQDEPALALWLSEWSDCLPLDRNTTGARPMHDALLRGWQAGALLMLRAGANPNWCSQRDPSGRPNPPNPLPCAFAQGLSEWIREAISSPTPADAGLSDGQWPDAIASRARAVGFAAACDEFRRLKAELGPWSSPELFTSARGAWGGWSELCSTAERAERAALGSSAPLFELLAEEAAEARVDDHAECWRVSDQFASGFEAEAPMPAWAFLSALAHEPMATGDVEFLAQATFSLGAAAAAANAPLCEELSGILRRGGKISAALSALARMPEAEWDRPGGFRGRSNDAALAAAHSAAWGRQRLWCSGILAEACDADAELFERALPKILVKALSRGHAGAALACVEAGADLDSALKAIVEDDSRDGPLKDFALHGRHRISSESLSFVLEARGAELASQGLEPLGKIARRAFAVCCPDTEERTLRLEALRAACERGAIEAACAPARPSRPKASI